VLFSGIHFPNVDGQPPGKLSQLQFRGSFSQVTGCKCPGGDCSALMEQCSACKSGTCSAADVKKCVDSWITDFNICPNAQPPILQYVSQSQTFLQISFGRNNYMSNTSTSADGEVGLPGWMFKNPLVVPSASAWSDMRNYAFANNKALTALVQIDTGVFSSAEWNWEKAESRCKSPSYKDGRTKAFYDNNLFNPCGRSTDNPCINNLVCAVTFDYCLLSMVVSNTKANLGVVAPECDLTISLAWQGTDANKRYCASQNQMFSKFNALGLDNLLQSSLSGATDVTSDIENKLKS
jgi:hypothetical protein